MPTTSSQQTLAHNKALNKWGPQWVLFCRFFKKTWLDPTPKLPGLSKENLGVLNSIYQKSSGQGTLNCQPSKTQTKNYYRTHPKIIERFF